MYCPIKLFCFAGRGVCPPYDRGQVVPQQPHDGEGVPELDAAAAAGDDFVVDYVRVYDVVEPVQAKQPAPFKDGDRVVFFGDSITHGGFYGEYVNLFYATRYPESPYDQTCLVDGRPSDIVCNDGLAILADHVRPKAHRFEIAAVAQLR